MKTKIVHLSILYTILSHILLYFVHHFILIYSIHRWVYDMHYTPTFVNQRFYIDNCTPTFVHRQMYITVCTLNLYPNMLCMRFCASCTLSYLLHHLVRRLVVWGESVYDATWCTRRCGVRDESVNESTRCTQYYWRQLIRRWGRFCHFQINTSISY